MSLRQNWLQNLQPEEAQILRVKYGATRFRNMSEEQIDLWGDAMLLKIAVITGWTLPSEHLQNILLDQFKKKMQESYADCNAEEVEYAFRNFGHFVKDWGKQINLNLIDEVMRPYLEKRRLQSVVEEHAAPPLLLKAPAESISHFSMVRWLAREMRYVRTGKPWEFIPVELYDYFDKLGVINATNEVKYSYLQQAVARRAAQLEKEAPLSKTAQDHYLRFKRMREMGCLSGNEAERVKKMAKKLLFFDLVTTGTDAKR